MAKKVKVIQCPNCGTLNSKNNNVCTNCGTNLKEPIYKRKWFIAIIVVVVLALCASLFGGSSSKSESGNSNTDTKQEEKITYKKYKVTKLFDELDDNAMKAEKNHQDEYVEITGYISNIDSDGSYVSIGANEKDYDYMFQSIQCYFHGDNKEKQKETVMNMSKGDKITIKGQITSIGEVLGYSVDIDEVAK